MKLPAFWKSRAFVVALLIVVAVAALAAWLSSRPEAVRYRSEPLDRGEIVQNVSANGTLNPVTLVSVGTQVSGTITAIYADYNDRVEKGQVLVQLDDALLRAALSQSEANYSSAQSALKLAQSDVERIEPLAKEGFVSQQELDKTRQALRDAQAKVTQTKAQVEKDRANLGYSVIRSPVSGVVVLRAVDAGQTVAASFNTPELFKIAQDLREMQIDAYFAEADIGQIRVGQQAKFRVDAFSGQRFTGTVKQIRLNPKTESNVVTYNVVISVANPDEKLLPGMTAYVDIAVQQRQNALRIPNTALRFRPTNEGDVVEAKTETAAPAAAGNPQEGQREGQKEGVAVAGENRQARGDKPGAGSDVGASDSNGERRPRREMSEEERAAWREKRRAEGGGEAGATGQEGPRMARGEGGSRAGGFGGARSNNSGRVYVLRDGKLHPLTVRTGITDRRYTELLSEDLREGDQVVVEEVTPGDTGSQQQRGMRFGM